MGEPLCSKLNFIMHTCSSHAKTYNLMTQNRNDVATITHALLCIYTTRIYAIISYMHV